LDEGVCRAEAQQLQDRQAGKYSQQDIDHDGGQDLRLERHHCEPTAMKALSAPTVMVKRPSPAAALRPGQHRPADNSSTGELVPPGGSDAPVLQSPLGCRGDPVGRPDPADNSRRHVLVTVGAVFPASGEIDQPQALPYAAGPHVEREAAVVVVVGVRARTIVTADGEFVRSLQER